MSLAAAALDFQPLRPHGGEMGSTRDKGDIGARFRQRRAESPSDTARADNRNSHRHSPLTRDLQISEIRRRGKLLGSAAPR
jgi:hypothetical protein